MLKDKPAKLRPYLFHGVDLSWSSDLDKEAQGTCPFCAKERHFYVNISTGQFSCKSGHCAKQGNIYSFLGDYWALCYETNTHDSELSDLAEERGVLRIETLRTWRIAKSLLTDEWIIPGYSPGKKVINLYRWAMIENRMRAIGTPDCNPALFGMHLLNKDKKAVHLCEGPWDGIVYWERLGMVRLDEGTYVRTADAKNSVRTGVNVLAVPGCNLFKEDWGTIFSGKDVVLLYDNDHPKKHPITGVISAPAGYSGMQYTYTRMVKPASAKIIDWGPEGFNLSVKDGYDIRDACAEHSPSEMFNQLKLREVPESWKSLDKKTSAASVPANSILPEPCSSYAVLVSSWRKALRWTTELDTALSVCLAVVASTLQKGDQLWVRLIGAPGVAKTRLCDAISVATQYCYTFGVSKGFHSGWRGDDPDEDYSVLAKCNGMTLVTKEGDVLLSSAMLQEILSQARDVYDGSTTSEWRNRKDKRTYQGLRMTWILAGTKSLRRLNRSNLGDRFIDCIINKPDTEEEEDILNRAVNLAVRSVQAQSDGTAETQLDPRLIEAYKLTGGYVCWLRENAKDYLGKLDCPESVKTQCKRLAQFVAYMRARPDKQDDEVDHESELPTRLCAQFIRLSYCLTMVRNKDHIDEEIMDIVRLSAMSTAHGLSLRIVEYLYQWENGLDSTTIALSLRMGDAAVRGNLKFMHTLGLVRPVERPNSKGKGQHRGVWELTMSMRRLYRDITEFNLS